MSKKKGSVLLLTIVIIGLLMVLALGLLSLSISGYAAAASYERSGDLKLSAETGIEKGIAKLKEWKAAHPSDDTVPPDSGSGRYCFRFALPYKENITCSVAFRNNINIDSNDNTKITIISTAATADGKYKKEIAAAVDKPGSFKSNSYLDDASESCITIIDEIKPEVNNGILYGSGSRLTVKGPVFVQGGNVNIALSNFISHEGISIKADNVTFSRVPVIGDSLKIDIDPAKFKNQQAGYFREVVKASFDRQDLLNVKSTSEDMKKTHTANEYLVYMINDNNINLRTMNEMESSIEDYIRGLSDLKPSDSLLDNLPDWLIELLPESISDYLDNFGNSTVYKVVMVKGNLTVNSGSFKNYIIYCDGKISISGDVSFRNSSLCMKTLELKNNSSLFISGISSDTVEQYSNSIQNFMRNNLAGYYDSVKIKITGWKER